jgi:hypothetical protein
MESAFACMSIVLSMPPTSPWLIPALGSLGCPWERHGCTTISAESRSKIRLCDLWIHALGHRRSIGHSPLVRVYAFNRPSSAYASGQAKGIVWHKGTPMSPRSNYTQSSRDFELVVLVWNFGYWVLKSKEKFIGLSLAGCMKNSL